MIEFVVPLYLLACIGLSALVWSTHQYPYPSKEDIQSGISEREFSEWGGYWSVLKGYKMYERGTGKLLREQVTPLRGLLKGSLITLLFLATSFIAVHVWRAINDPGQYTVVWTHVFLILTSIFVIFPDQFVKYSNHPGRIFWDVLKGDFPFSLTWWGLLLSVYGGLLILGHYTINDLPIVHLKLSVLRQQLPIFTAPVIWIGAAFGLEVIFLNPAPKMKTWRLFLVSWLIAAIGCWFLGLFLL